MLSACFRAVQCRLIGIQGLASPHPSAAIALPATARTAPAHGAASSTTTAAPQQAPSSLLAALGAGSVVATPDVVPSLRLRAAS